MNRTNPLPAHYTAAFQVALRFTLASEGGYVDDATDRGGETNQGISAAQYPELNIAELSESQSTAIYHRDFWMANRCDEWPVAMAVALFDTSVLMGADDAVPYLQSALGVKDDGVIGPKTLAAAWASDHRTVITNYLSYRARHHLQDVVVNRSQQKYVRGWLLRTYRLQQFLYQEDVL